MDLSLVDKALANKDVFTTLIVLFILVIIILPILYAFIKVLKDELIKELRTLGTTFKATFDQYEKHEKTIQDLIINTLVNHDRDSKRQHLELQTKMWNTVLNAEQTIDLLLSKMWFVSYWKLEFLRQVMIFNHIEWRREEITRKVKEELWRRSEDYLKDFRSYLTPVGDLSIWLAKNFADEDFNRSIDSIIDIIYSKKLKQANPDMSNEVIITIKVNDISTLMKTLQADLWKKLKTEIDSFNL